MTGHINRLCSQFDHFCEGKKKSSIQWTAAETEGWRVCIRFNVISAQMNQLYEKYTVCYTSRVLSTLYLIGCQKKLKKRRRKTNKNTEHVAVHYCRFSVFSKNVFLKKLNCCSKSGNTHPPFSLHVTQSSTLSQRHVIDFLMTIKKVYCHAESEYYKGITGNTC